MALHLYMSAGQLLGTNSYAPVIKNLAGAISSNKFIGELWVGLSYLFDKILFGTIDRFKKGKISEEKFCQDLRWQMGFGFISETVLSNERIIVAFNSMCEVSDWRRQWITGLVEHLEKRSDPLILHVLAVTMPSQWRYILEQVPALRKLDCRTSFDRRLLTHSALADTVNLGSEDVEYSLHKDVQRHNQFDTTPTTFIETIGQLTGYRGEVERG